MTAGHHLTRPQLERLLIGRTITAVVWNDAPVQVSANHSIPRSQSDLAALAILLDNGQQLTLEGSDQMGVDETWLSLTPPRI